jgi:hypothetical protein
LVKGKRKVTAKAKSGKGTAAAQNNARTPCPPPTPARCGPGSATNRCGARLPGLQLYQVFQNPFSKELLKSFLLGSSLAPLAYKRGFWQEDTCNAAVSKVPFTRISFCAGDAIL